ncbi:SAM-dependent methyltransferase [Allokutzneria albata]|uniref:S-adenosyl methyltransferase n=1 Tax=Allokutzneria albata TaxID=211114 RepID=A0A1G9ZGW1_ALLAB|nr:SAM-dependent methyltransferase [Allokutzneria albata]SDN20271.1 S-adenosyl methyltransferase [Allokutzneria albata]
MDRPTWVCGDIDLTKPSTARVYDYYLGGSHNFAVDRRQARQAIALWPELPKIMQANRAFLRRAVRFCVARGVRQFLDVGSGIPTVGNVHEIAQRADPDCRVVYVDIDPIAVAHSRALLAESRAPRTATLQADLRKPEQILDDPGVRELLDFDEPVALLMVSALHFVSPNDNPAALLEQYAEVLVPGSPLVISHGTADGRPERATAHEELYHRTGTPIWMRPADEIAGFFAGFDMVDPGLVYLSQWRPESPDEEWERPERLSGYAGLGIRN